MSLNGRVKSMPSQGDACISNFGIAALLMSSEFNSDLLPSPSRLAPEVLQGGAPTKESDVYSFAIAILELISGENPSQGLWRGDVARAKIQDGFQPRRPTRGTMVQRWLTDDLWALIQSCWTYDPQSRPTMKVVATRLHRI